MTPRVPGENLRSVAGHKYVPQYSSYIVATSFVIRCWWCKQEHKEKTTDQTQVTNIFRENHRPDAGHKHF